VKRAPQPAHQGQVDRNRNGPGDQVETQQAGWNAAAGMRAVAPGPSFVPDEVVQHCNLNRQGR
jgi:hypothetical protein